MNSMKLMGFLLLPVLFSFPVLAQTISGVMMVVKGDIKVTSADGKTENGKVGKKVSEGDTLISGPDGRAKVVMSDKNVINLSPDTKIKIEKYTNDGKDKKEVELNVVYGKVRASVEQKYDGEKSKFNIKTPSAVAGVRGTDFITGYNPTTKVSQVITFAGTVAVGTPGPNGTIKNPVFVQPGQMTEAGNGKTPEAPKSVPKEELNKMNAESKAETTSSKQEGQQKETKKETKKEKEDGDKSEKDSKDKSGDKKDDKKDDKDKSADKKDDKKGDKSATGPKNDSGSDSSPNGDKSRSPASEPTAKEPSGGMAGGDSPRGPSMFDPSIDNPGSTGNVILPGGPGMFTNFPPPLVTTPLPSQFIGDAIRTGQKSKTTIILNPQ